MPEDSDQTLLSSIAGGDDFALRELMGRYKEKVFRFAYRWVRNEADAAEIAAETFVRVHRYSGRYQPKAKASTWIYTITSNLCRDFTRKAWRRQIFSLFSQGARNDPKQGLSLEERIADDQPTAGQTMVHQERAAEILALIDKLPTKLKAPFLLHVLEEHSQRECATILGISEKAVETRIYRARKRLAEALADTDKSMPNTRS